MLETLIRVVERIEAAVFHAACCEEISSSQAIRCWRKPDSNPRSPRAEIEDGLIPALQPSSRRAAEALRVQRHQVRTRLFAGGRGIRTSGPTFKRTAVSRARPFVFWRPAAQAASVLVSENDDFELPVSQSDLARRAP